MQQLKLERHSSRLAIREDPNPSQGPNQPEGVTERPTIGL